MNKFYLEFFELESYIKNNINKDILTKKLIKLNNPTYYNSFIFKNPIERYGFKGKCINPVLLAINNMLKILNSEKEDISKNLQIEYSWAFNNYSRYKSVDL